MEILTLPFRFFVLPKDLATPKISAVYFSQQMFQNLDSTIVLEVKTWFFRFEPLKNKQKKHQK